MKEWEYVIWLTVDPFNVNTVATLNGTVLAETREEAFNLAEKEVSLEDAPYLMNWYVREAPYA